MDLSVAELKQQIDTEYKAAKLGLVGLSSGTSSHCYYCKNGKNERNT